MVAAFFSQPEVFVTSEGELITTVLAFLATGGLVRLLYQHWKVHNCHVRYCWRMQWKTVPGTDHVVCHHHHPHDAPKAAEVSSSTSARET